MNTKKLSPKPTFVSCLVAGLALFAVSCNDSNTGNSPDLSTTGDLSFFSCCGKEGDTGNSMGVGKFCRSDNDCTSGAPLCAIVYQAQKRSYFCTNTCDAPDMGTRGCGTGATCTRDSATGFYGCVPTACLTNMPAGCMN